MTIMDGLDDDGSAGMLTSTVQTDLRSVCEEDELLLDIELCRLQQQMHVVKSDRRAYREEACNLIRKQQAEIQALNDLNEEINKILAVTKSERTQGMDAHNIDQILGLMHKLNEYTLLCKKEEKKFKVLDGEILSTQEMNLEERKLADSATDETLEMRTTKRIHVLEKRLDRELIKYNTYLASNAQLRVEIDHLRIQKSVYDSIHKEVNDQMKEMKSAIKDSRTQAVQAHKERDAARSKMVALKDQSDKDMAQHEKQMAELRRIIRHDNQLKQFMAIKQHYRANLWDEELAEKQKDKRDKVLDYEKQSMLLFEDTFRQITMATCEHDITKIVNDFIKREHKNVALYNNVNELNDRVENIQGEITRLQTEIKMFQEDDVTNLANRYRLMREIEIKAEKCGKESDNAEIKYTKVCKILDKVCVCVTRLFKEANCDSSMICDMLGTKEGVTNKNLLQYMRVIEQQTMKLINVQQYIRMKEMPSQLDNRGQAKSKQGHSTNVRHMAVAILPPNITDDDDFILKDGEIRPYTRNEIKSFIKHIKPSQKSSGKRNKAKSRN